MTSCRSIGLTAFLSLDCTFSRAHPSCHHPKSRIFSAEKTAMPRFCAAATTRRDVHRRTAQNVLEPGDTLPKRENIALRNLSNPGVYLVQWAQGWVPPHISGATL